MTLADLKAAYFDAMVERERITLHLQQLAQRIAQWQEPEPAENGKEPEHADAHQHS